MENRAGRHRRRANAWSGVVFAIIVMVIMTAFLYYRTNVNLKPRLKSLNQSLQVIKQSNG